MGGLVQSETAIAGVVFTPLKVIEVPDGNILHGMKNIDAGFNGFGEAYFSIIKPNTIKGWKRHFEMTLNLIVPTGAIRFVLYDDREGSGSQGSFQEVILSENNYGRLTIPPQIWFGFQGVGKDLNLLLNIANIPHDINEQENKELQTIEYDWRLRSL